MSALSVTALILAFFWLYSIETRLPSKGNDDKENIVAKHNADGGQNNQKRVNNNPLTLDAAQELVTSINKANGGEVATVEKTFLQDGIPAGWTGVILKSPGESGGKAVAFVTQDRNLVLGGLVVNKDGKDFVKVAYDAQIGVQTQTGIRPNASLYTNGPTPAPLIDVAAALSKAHGFPAAPREDNKGTLYVFADAQCHACKDFWKIVSNAAKDNALGGVGVQWLPVAILGEESVRLGGKLLEMKPDDAFKLESGLAGMTVGFNISESEGQPTLEAKQAMEVNQALYAVILASFPPGKPAGTPLLVWKTADGSIKASSGSMNVADLKLIVEQITQ